MKLNSKELLHKEKALYEYDGDDRMVSSQELLEDLKKTDQSVYKLNTGFPSMDNILGGVEAGELVIVTGPTSEGKTTMLMSITQNMAKSDVMSAWFTLEVTPRQFIQKIMAGGGSLPVFYVPKKNTDNQIDWLEDRIIEAKVKYDVKAVFIDHIHQIFSVHKTKTNLSLELGDLVSRIKDLAVVHNLAIFLIAHTKDDSQNPTREPIKEDIRDSGLISRLADTIIAVWRIRNEDDLSVTKRKPLNDGDNKTKIRVLKNRKTGRVGAFLAYHKNHYLSEQDEIDF